MKFEEEYKNAAQLISPDKEQLERMKANVLKNINNPPKRVMWQKIAYVGGSVAACAAITLVAVNVLTQIKNKDSMTDKAAGTINLMDESNICDTTEEINELTSSGGEEYDSIVIESTMEVSLDSGAEMDSTAAADNSNPENHDVPDRGFSADYLPNGTADSPDGLVPAEETDVEVIEVPVSQEPPESEKHSPQSTPEQPGSGAQEESPEEAPESNDITDKNEVGVPEEGTAEYFTEENDKAAENEADDIVEEVLEDMPEDVECEMGEESFDEVIEDCVEEEDYDDSAMDNGTDSGSKWENTDEVYCEEETTEVSVDEAEDITEEYDYDYEEDIEYDPMTDPALEYNPLCPWSLTMTSADKSRFVLSYKWYEGSSEASYTKTELNIEDSVPPVFDSGEISDPSTGKVYEYEFVTEDGSRVWIYENNRLLGEYIRE